GLIAIALAAIEIRRGAIDEQGGGFQRHVGVDEAPLDRLPVGQWLAEGRALLRIRRGKLEATPGGAECTRALLDAPGAEPFLPEAEAVTFLADKMALVDAHVVEHDFPRRLAGQRLIARGELDAGGVLVEHEAGDAAA